MPWPVWPRIERTALAHYVLPELGQAVGTGQTGSGISAKEKLRLVYEALAAKGTKYDREAYHHHDAQQIVRDPYALLEGGRDATCLDLALLFAGVCLGKDLLALVVVVEGHAFTAVAQVHDRRDPLSNARRGADGSWVSDGLLADDGATLRRLVESDAYIALECTGIAWTDFVDASPEFEGRVNGVLSFEQACAAGSRHLTEAGFAARPFRFAIDPAVLQEKFGVEPYCAAGRDQGIDDPAQAARLIREAAYAIDARNWPGNKADVSWVLEQIAAGFRDNVLAPKRLIDSVLRDPQAMTWAERDKKSLAERGYVGDDGYARVRIVLDAFLQRLPKPQSYVEALRRIDPALRGPLIKSEFYRRERDDFLAWSFLLLLEQLGERETLLALLRERLLAIPPHHHQKAFVATVELAGDVLGDEFPAWWEREIRPQVDLPWQVAQAWGATRS